jgi:hypothetical protein
VHGCAAEAAGFGLDIETTANRHVAASGGAK